MNSTINNLIQGIMSFFPKNMANNKEKNISCNWNWQKSIKFTNYRFF